MNGQAIIYKLEEEGIFHRAEEDRIIVEQDELPNDVLGEIAACNAKIRIRGMDFILEDDSPDYFGQKTPLIEARPYT